MAIALLRRRAPIELQQFKEVDVWRMPKDATRKLTKGMKLREQWKARFGKLPLASNSQEGLSRRWHHFISLSKDV